MNALIKRPLLDSTRIIQEGETLLRFSDNSWHDRDGLPVPSEYFAVMMLKAAQCWRDGKPVEAMSETDGKLPDIDALNAALPESEWGLDLNGRPKPPWRIEYVVHLLDPLTGGLYVSTNSTVGQKIAYGQLRDCMQWMQNIRGSSVIPLIALESRPMRTGYGPRPRPHFAIVRWYVFDGGEQGGLKLLPPVTLSEELNDSMPF